MRLNIFLNDNVRGSLHLKGGLPVFGKRRKPSHNRPRLSKEEETIMGILFRFGRKYRMQWEEMRAPFREFGPTTSDKSPGAVREKILRKQAISRLPEQKRESLRRGTEHSHLNKFLSCRLPLRLSSDENRRQPFPVSPRTPPRHKKSPAFPLHPRRRIPVVLWTAAERFHCFRMSPRSQKIEHKAAVFPFPKNDCRASGPKSFMTGRLP